VKIVLKMGDLDDFFAKKDKKKKGTKGFSKANTEILAKNLEEMERKEQNKQDRQEAYLPEGSLPSQATIELLQQVSELIQPGYNRATAAG
jgi:hypothetical protein